MTMTTTPYRSRDQMMTALAKANMIRSERAQLKRDARNRPELVLATIRAPSAGVRGMLLYDVLDALPAVGQAKVDRALMVMQISPRRTLMGLTDRQRDSAIAYVLDYLDRKAGTR